MTLRSEFRRSQGVIPFGVGSIIDFAEEALMMAGLDVWPTETAVGPARAQLLNACRVVDGRLAERLTTNLGRPIRYFLSPAEAPERWSYGAPQFDRAKMPFVRFPNWYFCPRCRVLKEIPWNAQSGAESLRCSHVGRRARGKGEPCGSRPEKNRPRLSPVRFVAACENGHIMDFPWVAWAHRESDKLCEPAPGDLYIYSTPAAGLHGVRVGCTRCDANSSMRGAFRRSVLKEMFGGRCPGHRPWLGPSADEVDCSKIPQTIQRGASNAYFSQSVSSILIPPHSARIAQILDDPSLWQEIQSLPLVDGQVHIPFLETKARNLGVEPEAFIEAVRARLNAQGSDVVGDRRITEEQYRFDEYNAFLGPRPPQQERDDFDTFSHDAGDELADFFQNIVLVRKLRETRVLTGFSRIIPPGALDGPPAELFIRPRPWLPGFSVRGEGIFLQFRREALDRWKQDQQEVGCRTRALAARLSQVDRQRGHEPRSLSVEKLLIHTFSHLLIRQLAFECGYDSASIRERLYVSSEPQMAMAGLLLYTASGDSEGTLGGLVRQGEPERLYPTIRAAMKNASICSSDPLCIESKGQGLSSLNLAACHACCLLPETSCEEGNLFLDRVLAIGTPDDPELGFFNKIL